ncbi:hypothetical protein F8R89_10415 [Streptomyces sp. SS1-1]|nr:hypothetical protein F8R89_10415 [Streptomyces sp. SS1-1]
MHPRCKLKRGRSDGGGRYGCRAEQALWAEERFTRHRGGTPAGRRAFGRGRFAIKVRNAPETVVWWDAQVPDRLPQHRGQAA